MRLATIIADAEHRVIAVEAAAEPQLSGIDLCTADPKLPSTMRGILSLPNWMERSQDALLKGRKEGLMITGRATAPISDPGKIVCIGLNYRDHAAESGMEIPAEPVCFSKFGNTIIGPGETIRIPAVSDQVDYEAELVVVIGRSCYRIERVDAMDYVAGYMNGNDVSARDWQLGKPGKQWLLGKTADTFAPIGPWIATVDEIPNPHTLGISLRLNGETMQRGSTSSLIFGVDELVAYLSQIMTLEPGDLIFTGTPAGVGMGRRPPVWLRAGDRVEVEIDGLGILENPIEDRPV